MTSAFLPFPPLFQWPSNEGFDYSFQYYYYHDSRKNGHSRHLWDEGFLEQDCGTNDGAMTYPPGTAIDNQLGTYLTNYIVTGLALVGAIFVYRQVVTMRRRAPPILGIIPYPTKDQQVPPIMPFFVSNDDKRLSGFYFGLPYPMALPVSDINFEPMRNLVKVISIPTLHGRHESPMPLPF
jgi:hypothetical protein